MLHFRASLESHKQLTAGEATLLDPGWKLLYRIAALAALLSAVGIVAAIPIYLLWPPPSTGILPTPDAARSLLDLFQQNSLRGMLDLDLIMLLAAVISIPLYLALFFCLRRFGQSLVTIALASALVGVATYLVVNPAITMLSLSGQYSTATSEAQRSLYVAAAQSVLANYQGSGFTAYYLLGAVATLLFAAVMLRCRLFGRVTPWLGLITGILMLVPANAGTLGVIVSFASLLPLLIWDLLLAWHFWPSGRPAARLEVSGHTRTYAHDGTKL